MVVGILLAGGIGQRMGAGVPKQFIEVNGKPIICYPLEIMQKHSMVDAIEVVCVENFIDNMWSIVRQNGFDKVKWITAGGTSCQESTWNGLKNLKGELDEEDVILIHMSSYPLANEEIITSCIESAEENGNGCTARPILFSAYFTEDRKTTVQQIDRDKLMLCTVPYAFRYGECSELYDRAFSEGRGVTGNVFTNTLYCDYGKRIYFTRDSGTNIKVTTPEDIKIMETFLRIMEQSKENCFK